MTMTMRKLTFWYDAEMLKIYDNDITKGIADKATIKVCYENFSFESNHLGELQKVIV